MTKNEIIKLINESLDMNNWTANDYLNGKEIDVFPEWENIIDEIVWMYRKVGWTVWFFQKGKRRYLSFDNPRKISKKSYTMN